MTERMESVFKAFGRVLMGYGFYPTPEQVGRRIGISADTVRRDGRKLARIGLMFVTRGPGNCTVYRLTRKGFEITEAI